MYRSLISSKTHARRRVLRNCPPNLLGRRAFAMVLIIVPLFSARLRLILKGTLLSVVVWGGNVSSTVHEQMARLKADIKKTFVLVPRYVMSVLINFGCFT